MRHAILITSALLLLVTLPAQASAVELAYTWKTGDTHRFRAQSTDTITMTVFGGGPAGKFTTDTTFAIHIDRVLPSGSAEATVVVEAFSVKDASGQLVAGLDGLPPNGVRSLARIDRKGHFVFQQVTYLLIADEGPTMLVAGTVGADGASATASADGEQVSVYAEFDPATGRLSAGYSVERIAKPRRKVAIREDARRVDVLPLRFLELLELPEGPAATGMTASATLLGFTINMTVEEATPSAAIIRTDLTTGGGGGDGTTGTVKGSSGDGFGFDLAVPGLGAISPGILMKGSFTSHFEPAAGRLTSVQGRLQVDAGPMKTDSVLTLKRQ